MLSPLYLGIPFFCGWELFLQSIHMKRLLLIDDDADCLKALGNRLRFTFRESALTVDTAKSASIGIILAHTFTYDAVIVDLVMPGTTGDTFIQQLKQVQPDAPIIVISGSEPNDQYEANERGFTLAFFPKPIDFSAMQALLKPLLVTPDIGYAA